MSGFITILLSGRVPEQTLIQSAAAADGSFAAMLQFEKLEIHKVFPRIPNFALQQNLSSSALAIYLVFAVAFSTLCKRVLISFVHIIPRF